MPTHNSFMNGARHSCVLTSALSNLFLVLLLRRVGRASLLNECLSSGLGWLCGELAESVLPLL
jgi:hypothetical protein